MKFMTISIIKDTFYTLPKAEQDKILAESIQWIIDLKKKMGTKFTFYGVPGWDRVISIGEYSSLEEYYQSLQSPRAGFNKFESYPLIEIDEKALAGYLEMMKTAK